MESIRVAQVGAAKAPFEVVRRPVPQPGPGQVRVAVEACGICHSDAGFVDATFPGVRFPLVPGHEIAGRVDAVGEGVHSGWRVGDRVAVGWFGGSCHHCAACREGDFIDCAELKVPGWAYDGGFADAAIVPADALARIPNGLTAIHAAPMACAGVTVFRGLRDSSARPGDLVAIQGIGGLGHLGVRYAAAMGFETVAIARGREKSTAAKELGAHHFVDSEAEDVAEALRALGGAKVVLATAPSAKAMASTVDGLRHRGELVVVGAVADPLDISPFQLISASRVVRGHPSGTAKDIEDTMEFSFLHGINPLVETASLDDVGDAYRRMISGEARFRMVLTTR